MKRESVLRPMLEHGAADATILRPRQSSSCSRPKTPCLERHVNIAEIEALKQGARVRKPNGSIYTFRGRTEFGDLWLELRPTRGIIQKPASFLLDAELV
jgi:hypothetical protein